MFKKRKNKDRRSVMEKPIEIAHEMRSPITDPNGSYTGVPINENEKPVQDADDI